MRQTGPWLIVVFLGALGVLFPYAGFPGADRPDIAGAYTGALIAAAATLAGVLFASGNARKAAEVEAEQQRNQVRSLVVTEMTILAKHLAVMVRLIQYVMTLNDHQYRSCEDHGLGFVKATLSAGLSLTRLIAPQIVSLSSREIAVITIFLGEFDLFLFDLARFSGSGVISNGMVRARTADLCRHLSTAFSCLAPAILIPNENNVQELATDTLTRLANVLGT